MKRVTKQHEEQQERAAQRYGEARGLFMERAPGGHFGPVDYVAKESDRMGAAALEVVELKCRSCGVEAFSTVWCEVRKVQSLRRWAELYAATGYFVVAWSDGEMRRIEVSQLVSVCGAPRVVRREDRPDAEEHDTDVVYMVPVAAMERVVCGGERKGAT